jgi:hypothetical protein
VHAVEGEREVGFLIESLGGFEEIDEGDLLLLGHLLDGAGVEGEVDVVGGAVREVRALVVLVGDRGEEDEAGRGLAVELLAAVLVDHRAEVGLELGDVPFRP